MVACGFQADAETETVVNNLGAESCLRVKESAAELAVFPRGDDALALCADTARPAGQRTGHVTQVRAP